MKSLENKPKRLIIFTIITYLIFLLALVIYLLTKNSVNYETKEFKVEIIKKIDRNKWKAKAEITLEKKDFHKSILLKSSIGGNNYFFKYTTLSVGKNSTIMVIEDNNAFMDDLKEMDAMLFIPDKSKNKLFEELFLQMKLN